MTLSQDHKAVADKFLDDYEAGVIEQIENRDQQIATLTQQKVDLAAQLQAASNTSEQRRIEIVNLKAQILGLEARIRELEGGTTPPGTTYPSRRSGPGYVEIEALGVPITPDGLMEGARKTIAQGKQVTLPKDFPLINDYKYGTSGNYFAGLFFDESQGSRITGLSGTVDTATGLPVTKLGMVPMSSRFTASSALSPTGGTTQSQLTTIRGALAGKFILQDVVLQGSKQPHYHHGVRTEDGVTESLIENVIAIAASQGDNNMPPGEDYTFGLKNPTMRKVRGTGRLDGALHSSTFIGVFGTTSLLEDVTWEDGIAGFHTVYWATTGNHVARRCKTVRPGTGPEGKNGAGFNVEQGLGNYLFEDCEWLLDGAWPNPKLASGQRIYPSLPAPRHEGKFGHIIILGRTSGRPTGRPNDPEVPFPDKPSVTVINPIYEPWGHPGKAGFHVFRNHTPDAVVKVIDDGVTLQKVFMDKWWVPPTSFNPATQYLESSMDPGTSSVWG